VQIGKNTFAHLLCCAPNGFDPDTKRPRAGFHSFVIRIRIKDEQDQYFLSRGVKEENVIDITLEDGSVVSEENYSNRTIASFFMYTSVPLVESQLKKQAVDFLGFVNNLEWKGKPLASRAALLTPSPWLKKEKIGNWVGTEGVMKLVSKVDKSFTPYDYWANNNQNASSNFWAPGSWTYSNAAYFGCTTEWLNAEGKVLHAEAQREKGEEGVAEGSDEE